MVCVCNVFVFSSFFKHKKSFSQLLALLSFFHTLLCCCTLHPSSLFFNIDRSIINTKN